MTAALATRPARRGHLRAVPTDQDAERLADVRERVTAKAGGFKAEAKRTLREAREALGMTPDEFAEFISDALGERVIHGAADRWERNGCAPPGEVLVLALTVLREAGVQ
jgi:hypothetical protein